MGLCWFWKKGWRRPCDSREGGRRGDVRGAEVCAVLASFFCFDVRGKIWGGRTVSREVA